jgi:cytochrome c-type biogenesis protein CcmH/NrfF
MTLANAAVAILWALPVLLQLFILFRLARSTNEAQRYLSGTKTEEQQEEMVSTDTSSKFYPYLM